MCQYNDNQKGCNRGLDGEAEGKKRCEQQRVRTNVKEGGDYMKGKERTSKGRSEHQRGGVSVKREE